MGVQSLQDFVDSSGTFGVQLGKHLAERKDKTSNLLLVHADSCLRHFYNESVDWVCGGQWSELFQCVEKFVRIFRQSDLELVIFFDGICNQLSLHQWALKHRFTREVVKETLSHIIHNQNIPFRTKTKKFVPPGAFKTALRLAFRACEVLVCCSIDDTYKESILYAKDENCIGILASDANFLLNFTPQYMSLCNSRWMKKTLTACKLYNLHMLLDELALTINDLPYLAALLGNFILSDNSLSSFFWDLIEDDSPLKKIKDSLVSDAVLPPSEVRLKCIAKFINKNRSEIEDVQVLSQYVFGKSTKVTVEEGSSHLKKVIDYYKDVLNASRSARCTNKDESNQQTLGGFPLPTVLSTIPGCKNRYKKAWNYAEKVKKTNQASQGSLKTKKEETTDTKTTLENPEQVLKQGTLEEAAQALEQLELKESAAKAEEKEIQPTKEESDEKPEKTIEPEEKSENNEINEQDVMENSSSKILLEYPREISITPVNSDINNDVLLVARKRHQCGQMCPEILNLLMKGEIIFNMTLDDELVTSRLSIPLIYRPLRQLVYGVLFGVKSKEVVPNGVSEIEEKVIENGHIETEELTNGKTDEEKSDLKEEEKKEENKNVFTVKEWCVYGDRELSKPDHVKAKAMNWGIPSLKQLWFGTDSEDNANRLKAFLSCMKSDTINMSNTAMVPQRLMLLCCVLRYLIQQDEGKSILTKQDIDAFLAQALSTQLTTEHNTQNLANIKLNQVDARCVQLAAIFMSGIENAIIANDACGSPVPWEFCCPWNFFDGKLFHSKWLQSTMNFSTTDLCEGKPHIAEKLERLRWCITEGLEAKYTITGLQENKKFFNPFGNIPPMQSRPMYGVMRPDGIYNPNAKQRSRGPNSRRSVHGSGGILHVAGVPVAHWGGNKAGVGYSKNAPGVVVGGPNSIDLPSDHRRYGRGGRGGNRGRGLLETPFISPWHQGFGYEDYVSATYDRYMKGVQKAEQVRAKLGKANHRPHVYSNRNRYPQYQQGAKSSPNGRGNLWLGKGRGQESNDVSPVKPIQSNEPGYGRGQWLSVGE